MRENLLRSAADSGMIPARLIVGGNGFGIGRRCSVLRAGPLTLQWIAMGLPASWPSYERTVQTLKHGTYTTRSVSVLGGVLQAEWRAAEQTK